MVNQAAKKPEDFFNRQGKVFSSLETEYIDAVCCLGSDQ